LVGSCWARITTAANQAGTEGRSTGAVCTSIQGLGIMLRATSILSEERVSSSMRDLFPLYTTRMLSSRCASRGHVLIPVLTPARHLTLPAAVPSQGLEPLLHSPCPDPLHVAFW